MIGTFAETLAVVIYTNTMCKTLSLADCEKMKHQLDKGIRPDTFKGMGLENYDLDTCKELVRIVINSKKEEIAKGATNTRKDKGAKK